MTTARDQIIGDKLARTDALDSLCHEIVGGRMLTEVAKEWGIKLSRLRYWIAADSVRSARVREARQLSAAVYDEKAEEEIRNATDDLGLKKAKELAHHYRWRASKIDVGQYGEKLDVGLPDLRESSNQDLLNVLGALAPGLRAHAAKTLGEEADRAVH